MIVHCPNVSIVFTHGVQLHGQTVGWAGINILPGLYLRKYFSNLYDVDTWKAYRLGVVHMPCHSVTLV